MSKKFMTPEEREEIVKILEQKPEIDSRVTFYKESLLAIDKIMEAIDERIERGYTTETFRLLGFPVTKKIHLDSYDIGKLSLEKKSAEASLFEKKRYFEMWMDRRKEYDAKFAELKADCDRRFDEIYSQAQEVMKTNPRLSDVMNSYKNENNDIKIKVEFFLYIKQEVENAIRLGKFKPTEDVKPSSPLSVVTD